MWDIWRNLGGTIPRLLDISVPGLDVKIRIPIPVDLPQRIEEGYLLQADREGEGYRLCTPNAVIKMCTDRLSTVPSWKALLQVQQDGGQNLALAWRRGRILDWVVGGKRTDDWAVMFGFCARQVSCRFEVQPFDTHSDRAYLNRFT